MKEENNTKSVNVDGTDKAGHIQQQNDGAESAEGNGNADSKQADEEAAKTAADNAGDAAAGTDGAAGQDKADAIDVSDGAEAAIDADTGGKKKKKGSEAMAWIRDILIAVLIAVIIAQFIQPTIVREHSMQETLQPNDYLILSKMSYKFNDIEYGDIVVFKSNVETESGKKKLLIKRVIAKGGDTIAIADGQVYRNGELLDEPYTKDGYTNGGLDEVTVPEGELFLMGDNRVVSVDSRSPEVGFVSEDLIVGKAVVRLFPFNQIGSVYKNLNESAGEDASNV